MLAQQLPMFGQNIFLIIGALLFSAMVGVVIFFIWTFIKVWLFRREQQRAHDSWRRQTRRADGRLYPPQIVGTCERCSLTAAKVYCPEWGRLLCASCYEIEWREVESPVPSTPIEPPHAERNGRSNQGDYEDVAARGGKSPNNT